MHLEMERILFLAQFMLSKSDVDFVRLGNNTRLSNEYNFGITGMRSV